jgi:hypothetical protein
MELVAEGGRPWLFEPGRFFFPVANDRTTPASDAVLQVNGRRHEDLIGLLEGGVNTLPMPAGDLVRDRADVVMAPLAWGLKAAPLLPEHPERAGKNRAGSRRCPG